MSIYICIYTWYILPQTRARVLPNTCSTL
jgi:hypothetical protein